jgi:hypothetical protein
VPPALLVLPALPRHGLYIIDRSQKISVKIQIRFSFFSKMVSIPYFTSIGNAQSL